MSEFAPKKAVTSYLVELVVAGDSIEEQQISRRLGLAPTRFFRKGQEKAPGSGSVWEQSVWSLEVLPAGKREWLSLEDGLTSLLRILMPAKDSLAQLTTECDVAISCGFFVSKFADGLTLSPKVFELLAQIALKVRISVYWSNE